MCKRLFFPALVALIVCPFAFARTSTPVSSAPTSTSLFDTESAQALSGWTLDNAGYWRADDLHGVYYNNVDGQRVTIGAGSGPALYILGNSTVYGYGLSDADTVPSLVQNLLPARRVVNLGAIPSTAVQQLAQLQHIPLGAGDTVLVLGGVSESAAMFNGSDSGKQITESEAALVPEYEQAIIRASDYVHGKGAQYIYLLQPIVFSMAMTAQEEQLADVNRHAQNAVAWPVLQAMIARLALRGIGAHDWTHVLDDYRRGGKLAYIDYCHLTPDSARYVAGLMVALGGIGGRRGWGRDIALPLYVVAPLLQLAVNRADTIAHLQIA